MASQSTDTTRAVRAEIKERLRPIGVIRSDLKDCADAPKQGPEGAPDTWVDMYGSFVEGLAGISAVRTHRPSQPLWRLCHIPKPYAVPPLEKEE
jgi:hypothetical protein